MKVLVIQEWDNPRDEDRRKQYTELSRTANEFRARAFEGIKHERLGSWTDNTGRIISLTVFENMEEYGKLWDKLEYHQRAVKGWRSVDNMKIRVCRPAILDPTTLKEMEQ